MHMHTNTYYIHICHIIIHVYHIILHICHIRSAHKYVLHTHITHYIFICTQIRIAYTNYTLHMHIRIIYTYYIYILYTYIHILHM